MSFFQTLPPDIVEQQMRFEALYTSVLSSPSSSMQRALSVLNQAAGKRLRPLCVLLIAGCYGEVTDVAISGAVFVELLHSATLMHDDVIDESSMRRGHPSLNAEIGNHKAVLMGDYVLSTALQMAQQTRSWRVMELVAHLGKTLAEGEFYQQDASEMVLPTEQAYVDIVLRKTAALFETSVQVGAISMGQDDERTLSLLEQAGQRLGVAFQIKDDILDYISTEKSLGKPVGEDLLEHKVTLPLIYALNDKEHPRRSEMISILEHPALTQEQITTLIDFAVQAGGVERSEQRVLDLVQESKELFVQALPECCNRALLLDLCDYVGLRRR